MMLRELLLTVTPMAFLALGLNEQFHEDPEWPPRNAADKTDPTPKQDPLAGFGALKLDGAPPADRPAPLQGFAPQNQPAPARWGQAASAPASANAFPGFASAQPVSSPQPASPATAGAPQQVPLAPDDPRVRQLRALDAAVEAGVLTEAEGAERRRTILATPPPPPPVDVEAVRRKRAAILNALHAEIISQEEADAKLAQLPAIPEESMAAPRDEAELHPAPVSEQQMPGEAKPLAATDPEPANIFAEAPRSDARGPQPEAIGGPETLAQPETDGTVAPSTTTPAPQPVSGPAEVGDTRGRFRLQLPEGWIAQDEAGTLRLTFGDAWAIFETSSEPGRPVDVAQRHAEKMRPFYSNWKVVNGGPFTTRRQRQAGGWTITASWNSAGGQQREAVLLVWSVNAGGDRFVTMTSSADSAVAQAANPALMSIFDSVKFAGE